MVAQQRKVAPDGARPGDPHNAAAAAYDSALEERLAVGQLLDQVLA